MNRPDLTKPFITSEDILVEVSNDEDFRRSQERYVLRGDGNSYICWTGGRTAKEKSYDITKTNTWQYARYPKEKKEVYMTQEEVVKFCSENPCIVGLKEFPDQTPYWSYDFIHPIKDYTYYLCDDPNKEVKRFTKVEEE